MVSKMVKTRIRLNKLKGVAIIVTGILLLVLLAIFVAYPRSDNNVSQQTKSADSSVHISVGPLTYDFSSGKAIKRTDQGVVGLRDFLMTIGKKEISTNCESVYYNVIVASVDEDQVLLNYGCGSPNARMFAVKKDTTWKLISPTNHFDMFGIPECSHVYQNGIDVAIAPVCGDGITTGDGKGSYVVRMLD